MPGAKCPGACRWRRACSPANRPRRNCRTASTEHAGGVRKRFCTDACGAARVLPPARTDVDGFHVVVPMDGHLSKVVLHAEGLHKRFGATRALDGAGLCLRAGEIHALLGQNGAGKSTLIKLLTGVETPDAGSVVLEGRAIAPASPLDAQHAGISTVYQEVNLCPNLSVAENLYAGRYPRRFGMIDWQRVRAGARQLLAELHLDLDVDRPLSSCPVAIQQMVAIARALGVSAKVLILDEPTSSLDEGEVRELFAVMRRLRERGMAILFVTHFLDQVYAVSDRITVLRNGGLV